MCGWMGPGGRSPSWSPSHETLARALLKERRRTTAPQRLRKSGSRDASDAGAARISGYNIPGVLALRTPGKINKTRQAS